MLDKSKNCALREDHKLYTSISAFVSRTLKSVSLRKRELKSMRMFYFNKYKPYIRRTCGFKPGIAMERKLSIRIHRAGYGRFLLNEVKLQPDTFNKNLRKAAVSLMQPKVSTFDAKMLKLATIRVLKNLKFEKAFKPTSLRFATTLLNSSASSGFPFIGRKGKNVDAILKMGQAMRKNNLSGAFKYFPNLCSFRLQQRGTFPKLSVKTRVMYPYPGAITLIEQSFIFPILKYFERNKGKTFYTLGMNGLDMTKWLKHRHKTRLRSDERIVSLDVSAYDQNISNEILSCAFWIARQFHCLDRNQALLFNNQMLHSLVSYQAMVYKGKPHMFIKDHGIPSGSSWTNLIGTLCHAIVAEYTTPNILAEGNTLLCSDDNIFVTTHSLEYIKNKYKELGLEISIDKTDHYRSWSKVDFLGYSWVNCIRQVNIPLCLNQMVYHSQFLHDMSEFDREIARSASILLTGVNGQTVFRKLFPEIIDQLNKGKDVRFNYLFGYSNPVTNPNVIGKLKSKTRSTLNESLLLHLEKGHFIR